MVIKKFKKKVKGGIFYNYCFASFNLLYDVNYFLFFFTFGMDALATCVGGVYVLYELLSSDCSSDYFFFNSPKNKEAFEAWVKLQKPLILSPSEKSANADFSESVKPLTEVLFFVEASELQTIITPLEDETLKAWDDYLTSLKQEPSREETLLAQMRLAVLLKRSAEENMKKDAEKYSYALIVLVFVAMLLCY